MTELGDKTIAIHRRLADAGIEHAIGGALALGYWLKDPRGTRDLDLNIFLPPEDCERVLNLLPDEIAYDRETVKVIKRDGQIRLRWAGVPIDLFFSYHPIHDQAARHRRTVVFEGEEIPILGPIELAVFKVMFNRLRDWGDIEEMLKSETLDVDAVREELVKLIGADDERLERLDEVVQRQRPDQSS